MSDNYENNNNDRNSRNVDNSANKSDINNGRDARSKGYGDYGENSVIDENMQDNFIKNNSKLANNGQNDMSGLSSDQNTDNVSAMENSDKTKGPDSNASQTAQTAKDAKTAEDNAKDAEDNAKDAKDAKDTAKDAASEASDAASDAAGAAGKGKVMTAFNVTDNLKASAQEAEAQDAEQSMKDVAKDTVKAAPKVAVDAASGNVPGIVADAVDYASKTLPKLVKILPVLLLCVLLIGASIFSMVGMLPSVMYGGLEEKVEERQINKAQNVIEEEYEKRISAVVSDIIKQTKKRGGNRYFFGVETYCCRKER